MKSLSDLTKEITLVNEELEHFRLAKILSTEMSNNWLIDESHGTYKGHIELARYLAAICDEYICYKGIDSFVKQECIKFENDELEKLKYENIFFKELYLKPTKDELKYVDHGNWIEKEKKFEYIVIYVKISNLEKLQLNYDKIFKEITHELLHAFGDYQTYLTGKDKHLFDYYNIKSEIPTKYASVIGKFEAKSPEERTCKEILYSLIKTEQNSFISEINTIDFSNCHSYEDAVKLFNTTVPYRKYKKLKSKLDFVRNRDEFVVTYNKILNCNKTWDKIHSKLSHKLKRAQDKIVKYGYMAYSGYIEKKNEIESKTNQNKGILEAYDDYLSFRGFITNNEYKYGDEPFDYR